MIYVHLKKVLFNMYKHFIWKEFHCKIDVKPQKKEPGHHGELNLWDEGALRGARDPGSEFRRHPRVSGGVRGRHHLRSHSLLGRQKAQVCRELHSW